MNPIGISFYYSAGRIGMEIPDTANSVTYYNKSLKYNTANPEVKCKANLNWAIFHTTWLNTNLPWVLRQYRPGQPGHAGRFPDDRQPQEKTSPMLWHSSISSGWKTACG